MSDLMYSVTFDVSIKVLKAYRASDPNNMEMREIKRRSVDEPNYWSNNCDFGNSNSSYYR